MVDSITLQLLDLEITQTKKRDLQKKLNMAINIVKKFETPCQNKQLHDMKDIADVTGVSSETLEMIKKYEETNVKFKDWLTEMEYNDILYRMIRNYLLKSYTQSYEIPSKRCFLSLMNIRYCTVEIDRQFSKFFTSIKLPGTEASIIAEKPEILMKRFQYLHTKLSYQKQGRTLVYIGAANLYVRHGMPKIGKSIKDNAKMYYVAASRCGYISSLSSRVGDEIHVKHWITDKVIATLPPGTVLVLCDDDIWCEQDETPGSNASKTEMIRWLNAKDIPHDPNTHRAELFKLIDNYRARCRPERANIEKFIMSKGYVVLQRPKEVIHNFFHPFWKQLKERLVLKKEKTKSSIYHLLPYNAKLLTCSLSAKFWAGLELDLVKNEVDLYNADLQVETVIDKLLTFAKHEHLDKNDTSDLDTYRKAMDSEYIFNVNKV